MGDFCSRFLSVSVPRAMQEYACGDTGMCAHFMMRVNFSCGKDLILVARKYAHVA